MKEMNTVEYLKRVLDDAIYTYGHCLCGDIDATGLTAEIERWAEMSVDLSNKLDDALYAIRKANQED